MKKIKGGLTLPKGFLVSAVKSGVKASKKFDLGCIYSPFECKTAAVYTKNVFAAAPILFTQQNLKKSKDKSQLILINSGIANACTGEDGLKDCSILAEALEKSFKIDKEKILLCSTGKIGKRISLDKIVKKIPELKEKLSNKGSNELEQAILTTDKTKKTVSMRSFIDDKPVNIGGICKGSGMINPAMATMLCFITTDVNISGKLLNKALKEAVDDSFNCITVDGDMSTNDTVLLMANSKADNRIIKSVKSKEYHIFASMLNRITLDLAKKIVEDGEGATKFITIKVKNALTLESAKKIGKMVANSNLVKTAFFGEDFNWGRIVSAVGASGEKICIEKFKLYLSNYLVFSDQTVQNYNTNKIDKLLKNKNINITIDIGFNTNNATNIYTTDLSYDYVKINSEYST